MSNYYTDSAVGFSVEAPNGITIKTENGALVTSDTKVYKGDNIFIAFNYGYNKKVEIKDNGVVIATAVGPATLKYPVTANVNLTVVTSDITKMTYDGVNASSNANIVESADLDEEGFISLPGKRKWSKNAEISKEFGATVSSRVVSFEMKVSDLKKMYEETQLWQNIGICVGDNTNKYGIERNVTVDGDYYVLQAYNFTATQALKVSKTAETFKMTFVISSTKADGESRTVEIYLDGVKVGTTTTGSACNSQIGMWFDTRDKDIAIGYRFSYVMSKYVAL